MKGPSGLLGVLLWSALLVAGCGQPSTALERRPEAPPIEATRPLPGYPDAWVFSVPLDRASLRIVDVSERSLSRIRSDDAASLVFNAGFFDPDFAPEGLSVSESHELSPLIPSLSGGVFSVEHARASLHESETYAPTQTPEFAVQCRPRLVVDGANNIASDNGRLGARTALCIREEGLGAGARVVDVVIVPSPGATLYQLAEALIDHGCTAALNLDGGPSTGVAWAGPDGPHAIEPRGPVRQAILVQLR